MFDVEYHGFMVCYSHDFCVKVVFMILCLCVKCVDGDIYDWQVTNSNLKLITQDKEEQLVCWKSPIKRSDLVCASFSVIIRVEHFRKVTFTFILFVP